MADKKAKTKKVKKITEIPEASVKIEVEQNEVVSENETEEEVKTTEESTNSTEKTESEENTDKKEETEEDDEVVENFDDENSGFFSWKKVFLFTVIAAATGLVIVAVYLVFLGGYDVSVTKPAAEEKSIEVEETTPTPTPDGVDRSAYDIEVLNGSGIEGEAASIQELLEDEDFTVSGIGNADNSEYLETQILFKESVDEEYLNELQGVLEERGSTETNEAESDQAEDVVVIVGSETSNVDATPTPDLE